MHTHMLDFLSVLCMFPCFKTFWVLLCRFYKQTRLCTIMSWTVLTNQPRCCLNLSWVLLHICALTDSLTLAECCYVFVHWLTSPSNYFFLLWAFFLFVVSLTTLTAPWTWLVHGYWMLDKFTVIIITIIIIVITMIFFLITNTTNVIVIIIWLWSMLHDDAPQPPFFPQL